MEQSLKHQEDEPEVNYGRNNLLNNKSVTYTQKIGDNNNNLLNAAGSNIMSSN
jgi:hypothetical protein